jgi:hypothetical protein
VFSDSSVSTMVTGCEGQVLAAILFQNLPVRTIKSQKLWISKSMVKTKIEYLLISKQEWQCFSINPLELI